MFGATFHRLGAAALASRGAEALLQDQGRTATRRSTDWPMLPMLFGLSWTLLVPKFIAPRFHRPHSKVSFGSKDRSVVSVWASDGSDIHVHLHAFQSLFCFQNPICMLGLASLSHEWPHDLTSAGFGNINAWGRLISPAPSGCPGSLKRFPDVQSCCGSCCCFALS